MDLLKKLAHLETHAATRQYQLAQLTLELLQEWTERHEQCLHALEALIQPTEKPEALQRMGPRADGCQTSILHGCALIR